MEPAGARGTAGDLGTDPREAVDYTRRAGGGTLLGNGCDEPAVAVHGLAEREAEGGQTAGGDSDPIAVFDGEARRSLITLAERVHRGREALTPLVHDQIIGSNAKAGNLPGFAMGDDRYATAHQAAIYAARDNAPALWDSVVEWTRKVPSPEVTLADIQREAAIASAAVPR